MNLILLDQDLTLHMSFGMLKELHEKKFRSIAPGVKALESDKES